MGMNKCECGNMVHSDAKNCPNCGKQNYIGAFKNALATVVMGIVIVLVVVFLKETGIYPNLYK